MISIEKWSGMITNASPYALPGGACVHQANIQCLTPGQLQLRGGMQSVATIGTSTSATTQGLTQVVAAVRYSRGQERILVHCGTSISMATIT